MVAINNSCNQLTFYEAMSVIEEEGVWDVVEPTAGEDADDGTTAVAPSILNMRGGLPY